MYSIAICHFRTFQKFWNICFFGLIYFEIKAKEIQNHEILNLFKFNKVYYTNIRILGNCFFSVYN